VPMTLRETCGRPSDEEEDRDSVFGGKNLNAMVRRCRLTP
jgi:hypothetical protein